MERISRISEYWCANWEKEIDRIDRENRSRAATRKIVGSARLSLGGKMEQALVFFNRWLSLIREHPGERPKFHAEQAAILRANVNENAKQALAEIEAVATPVAHCAGALLRRYTALFEDAVDETGDSPVGLTELLNGELLADPRIALDETGQPPESPLDLDTLRKLAQQDAPDFGNAAVERARRGDFLNAETTLDFAQRTGWIDDESADRSRNMLDAHRARFQRKLSDRIRNTTDRLDAAYAEGTLTLDTHERQSARIPHPDFAEAKIYAQHFSTLDEIDEEIEDAKANRGSAIRQALATLVRLSQEERDRIDSVVDSGHFQIAEDFIERIERGEKLPETETTSDRPFDRFYPNFVEKYPGSDDKEGAGVDHVRRVIESGESSDLIDVSGISQDKCRDGLALLDSWIALRNDQTSIDPFVAFSRECTRLRRCQSEKRFRQDDRWRDDPFA